MQILKPRILKEKAFSVINMCFYRMIVYFNCSIVDVCFGLQESEGGLYVCMNTFLGFGREHVERHYRKTGQSVYMHLKRHVKEVCFTPSLSGHGL